MLQKLFEIYPLRQRRDGRIRQASLICRAAKLPHALVLCGRLFVVIDGTCAVRSPDFSRGRYAGAQCSYVIAVSYRLYGRRRRAPCSVMGSTGIRV